ncbi:MAG: complex I NDUFA9 subunit family protein, partial [Rhodobacteraceae bacterium]|nr:complex I NDUFA9 subunit family protein [Paracoccaceae bacterium]
VGRLVHISAIGADADSNCDFARSKAEGEAAVLTHMPDAVILRPSAMFGTEDTFFNFYAGLTRLGPVMPIVGGNSLFQPVYVEDVARAAESGVVDDVVPGVYELGGPDVISLRDLIDGMLGVIRRRRLVLNMPFFVARLMAFSFDMMQVVSLGLITNAVLTRDQVRGLAHDNKVSDGTKGLADLGIAPVPMEAVLSDYLWRFRPSGQYDAIKESARKLRT